MVIQAATARISDFSITIQLLKDNFILGAYADLAVQQIGLL